MFTIFKERKTNTVEVELSALERKREAKKYFWGTRGRKWKKKVEEIRKIRSPEKVTDQLKLNVKYCAE